MATAASPKCATCALRERCDLRTSVRSILNASRDLDAILAQSGQLRYPGAFQYADDWEAHKLQIRSRALARAADALCDGAQCANYLKKK